MTFWFHWDLVSLGFGALGDLHGLRSRVLDAIIAW
jgi:hypothetical protein